MGWTSYHATFYTPSGQIDRKAECDAYWLMGLNRGYYCIEKSAMVGSTYYAAVRITKRAKTDDDGNYVYVENGQYTYEEIPREEQRTFGVVILTSTDSHSYYNFSYKVMDESVGPCYYDCPISILKLLTPTNSAYAVQWRKNCYEHFNAKKKLNSAPIGATIRFLFRGEEVSLVKRAPAYQFKTPFWYNPVSHTYMKQSQIPLEFTLQTA